MLLQTAGLALALAAVPLANAVINVGLQPSDLFERHESVLSGEIVSLDRSAGRMTIRVDALLKGEGPVAGSTITVEAAPAMAELLAEPERLTELAPGKPIAAFVGKRLRRRENDLLFYAGGFYLGEKRSDQAWSWTGGDSQLQGVDGQAVPTMLGTWNGSTRQLIRMLEALSRDEAFFPRRGYASFKPDLLIDQLAGPVLGVALYDIDRNGLPDAYACSLSGDRVYFQMEPQVFVDATEWLGLDQASASCSFADYDLDGVADLLAGGSLLRGRVEGSGRSFVPGAELPLEEAALDELKAAAFVEINGDGFPDIVASVAEGGLRILVNPGPDGGPFSDRTADLGLTSSDTGFFAAGDWNGDGRVDLFHAAGAGRLYVQDSEGRFQLVPDLPPMRFLSGPEERPGLTGAGAFAPILGSGRFDLIVPVESGWHVIENRDGIPVDVTEHGNEISEGSYLHLATLAEDLNLDGHVDLYTVSRARNGHNRFIINRGYGSFMLGDVHRAYDTMFNGPAQELGGWGIASGDADRDGQPDLLIGNELGHLVLIRNDTLAHRKPVENPIDDVARLLRASVVRVQVDGPRGVVGAVVEAVSSEGEVIDARQIGANIASGCRSSDEAFFALRNPGSYEIRVRYADGVSKTYPIVAPSADGQPIHLVSHR